jgi:antitoxin component of MazEF toxin-antitoxin module
MIKTIQKIIRIGSSAGVTIPKKQLDELNLNTGDEVKVSLEPVKQDGQAKLMREYDEFVKQYGQTLKNLAKR